MANLTQLKMLEDLNGFLLVDKPVGIPFASVVKAVKRKFNLVKVGHGGSLDATASGLFVVLINDANRYANDVMGADRDYEGVMRLGLRTATHDTRGARLGGDGAAAAAVDAARLEAAFKGFKGDVFQTEPRYSTIRKEGTGDYETADTGDHEPFLAHVYRLKLTGLENARATFSVSGTKGLLVRTLVNDIGEELGCGAALESLRRTRVGKFNLDDAIAFDTLLATEMKDFASCVKPMSFVLR